MNQWRGRRLAAVVGTTTLLSACQGDWTTFESAEFGFSVEVPGSPNESYETVHTAGGLLEFHRYSVEVPRDLLRSQTFINYLDVGCANLPEGGDGATTLRQAEDWVPRQLQGQLEKRRAITAKSIPGMEMEIRKPHMLYVVRVFADKNRVYQLVAGKSGNLLLTGAEARFMDSFLPR